jgi:ribosomal protein S18 acetylase RimI-like enzyme
MRSLRLFVAFCLLKGKLLFSIHEAHGFLPKKTLVPHGTATQQQRQQQSRDSQPPSRRRSILRIQYWNHRWNSLRVSQDEPDFFVRKSLPVDMGRASKILADGFFKGKTNWLTYQLERLETYLSLESTFPKPNTPHVIFVACESRSGQVLGMVELDARKKGKNKGTTYSKSNDSNDGPYMCNVAVDDGHLRKGIATALIRQCEWQVQKWHVDSNGDIPCRLYLKVRSNNQAAIRMYSKLNYWCNDSELPDEWDPKSGQAVYVMRKDLDMPTKSISSPAMNDNVCGRQEYGSTVSVSMTAAPRCDHP